MNLQTFSFLSGSAILAISVLVENMSKKFKPWTFIFKWVGKTMNAEALEKLESLDKRIGKLEQADIKQEELRKESEAKEARRRIITFADELRRNIPHSQETFDNILDDISYYKNYCRDHPGFKNEKAVRSISIVDEVYDKCMREDSFL